MRPTIGVRSILIGVSFMALTSAATLAADTAPPSDATAPATQPQGTTTPATTGTPAEGQPQPQADTSKDKEIVCKKMDPPTGSHMGGKKVCRTVAEWRAIAADAKAEVDGMQASSRADTPDAQ